MCDMCKKCESNTPIALNTIFFHPKPMFKNSLIENTNTNYFKHQIFRVFWYVLNMHHWKRIIHCHLQAPMIAFSNRFTTVKSYLALHDDIYYQSQLVSMGNIYIIALNLDITPYFQKIAFAMKCLGLIDRLKRAFIL